jgi:lactate dehydrogenase-like 2-hydroxyacid dehydrogenase
MKKVSLAGTTKHCVLITRPLSSEAMDRLGTFFEIISCEADDVATRDGFLAQLQSKAAALIGPDERLDAEMIECLPALKAVCNLSAEFDNLDLQALTKAGVHAMHVPGYEGDPHASRPTAQLAVEAAENVIAAFGFGRLGGRPPNLLNPELLCECC